MKGRRWRATGPRLPDPIPEVAGELDAEVTIRLPTALARRLEKYASDKDVTQGAIVRVLLDQGLPKMLARKTEDPVAYDHDATAEAFSSAAGWSDLADKLARLGLEVAPRGGEIAVLVASTGDVACKASDVGHGYSDLIRRFGEGLPGHPHTWLVERVLSKLPTGTPPQG